VKKQIITPAEHKDIIKEFDLGRKWSLKADAVVIGSGAGGAVTAAELAKNGWKVVLIEEGSYFHPGIFSNDEFLSQARLYRDAGYVLTENQTASIVQGRTLGGSTTVNWQTSLYPPSYVTDEWRDRFGLPGYGRKEEISSYVEEVHKRLNVHEVPTQLINRNNGVLMRGGRKLGLHPEVLKNNNNGCKGLGRCGLGCPINAKQSMFLTYIPDAIASGAIVVTNMRAVKISDGKTKRVTAEFTPDPYQASPEEIIEEMQIEAPVVIVSCGALEGPALLQRSGLGNEMVGKNLKLHPTCTIFARFNSKIDMWHGPPQSVVIKDGHNQKGTGYGFWLEVAPFRPTLTSAIIPFYGARQFRNIKDYTKFNAGIVLVRDGADGATKGKVEWSWGKRKVHYEITRTDGTNMLLGLKMLAEVQAAAGATELIFPFTDMLEEFKVVPGSKFDWVLSRSFEPGVLPIGSAHPHGSIQASSDPKTGAIDPNFELYGHRNIFVMDASWIPTGLSVNPQITTMSSALRAARKLAGEKSKRLD
jgi:choline dehydrogenase-like flavoprotein